MRKLKISVTFALLLFCLISAASAKTRVADFSFERVTVEDSKSFWVPLSIECEGELQYLNISISLPEGFLLNAKAKGEAFDTYGELLSDEKSCTLTVYSPEGISPEGKTLLLKLNFIPGEDTPDGIYKLSVTRGQVVTVDGETAEISASDGEIHLKRDKAQYCSHRCNGWTVTKAPTYTAQGERVKICTECSAVYKRATIAVTPRRAISACVISGEKSLVYTGSKLKPELSVTYKGTELHKGIDYTVSYSENVAVGTGKITVKGKGAYKGSKTFSFTITPGRVKGLRAGSKGKTYIALSWSKLSEADSYRIYRYDDTKEKWIKIGETKRNSFRVKNLGRGKKYKFRVRATAQVKGKSLLGKASASYFCKTNR